ncbi:unnamed protein product [Wuchereria bancrofti]|uniref:Uncharacterized protein n=1 Tax=Wuchereria bancrofti TaxID=6293 RepID=A0A3P7DV42_WUCBA|nr:unnamed protein product [Wuchereria bancrofti]
MANTYDTNNKFMVTLSTDVLQIICNEMEDDNPEAEDDEPFTSDLMDEIKDNAEVIDISTPSKSPSRITEYLMIIPLRHRRSVHSFSPTLSQRNYH